MKDAYIKNVKSKIKQFSDFLGDKKWFGGTEVCIYIYIYIYNYYCILVCMWILSDSHLVGFEHSITIDRLTAMQLVNNLLVYPCA